MDSAARGGRTTPHPPATLLLGFTYLLNQHFAGNWWKTRT